MDPGQLAQIQPTPFSKPHPRAAYTFSFDYGLNENITPSPQECTYGYNFDLSFADSSFRPRAPFKLLGTAPNAGAITGILQLVTRANVATTLIAAGTVMYKYDGTTFTSKGSLNASGLQRADYWSLGDYLVISDVNLQNVVMKWDGTTLSNLTTTGATNLYAKYVIVTQNRVWWFNVNVGGVAYPHMILVSKFEDPTNYDTSARGGPTVVGGGSFSTGLEAFYLLTQDLKPINGVALFQNNVVISTTGGRIWVLTGTSASTYSFVDFYDPSPALGVEAIKNVGNDVIYVQPGGSITKLSATQAYGNVFTANLNGWLPLTTKGLTTINKIVYDIAEQKVFLFIPNKVLVLYKDLLPQDNYEIQGNPSPWSVYTTQHPNAFNSSAAEYIYSPGQSTYSVIWGDSSGNVFDMNGTTGGDAGAYPVASLRRSIHLTDEVIRPWIYDHENISCRVNYTRLAQTALSVSVDWDDEYNTTMSNITLKGPTSQQSAYYFGGTGMFGGAYYFGSGLAAVARPSSFNTEPGGKGPGCYITLSASSNFPFQIDSLVLDS